MASKIFPLQKENSSHILKPGCGSEKDLVYLQIVNPLHEKCVWPSKSCIGS